MHLLIWIDSLIEKPFMWLLRLFYRFTNLSGLDFGWFCLLASPLCFVSATITNLRLDLDSLDLWLAVLIVLGCTIVITSFGLKLLANFATAMPKLPPGLMREIKLVRLTFFGFSVGSAGYPTDHLTASRALTALSAFLFAASLYFLTNNQARHPN